MPFGKALEFLEDQNSQNCITRQAQIANTEDERGSFADSLTQPFFHPQMLSHGLDILSEKKLTFLVLDSFYNCGRQNSYDDRGDLPSCLIFFL